jgi:hypothetical protein
MVFVMFAGTDTSSQSMNRIAQCLANHPQWLDALWEEQKALIEEFGEDINRKVCFSPTECPPPSVFCRTLRLVGGHLRLVSGHPPPSVLWGIYTLRVLGPCAVPFSAKVTDAYDRHTLMGSHGHILWTHQARRRLTASCISRLHFMHVLHAFRWCREVMWLLRWCKKLCASGHLSG